MAIQWTKSAQHDLVRLHAFLLPVNPRAAAQLVRQLISGAEQLTSYPHLGAQLEEFAPRDVRRVILGDYELRYEVAGRIVSVLRIWHSREHR